jgi:REP element-mobilizing transposase RayT
MLREGSKGFLARLGQCRERFELDVFAYVLMSNHYHLLVTTREANLSRAMQWLSAAYSSWHNAGHHRSGHLFQGRFKSFLVPETSYLYRLLLYIHRNPLRAKIVANFADYRWSSYLPLGYGRLGPDWFKPQLVYDYFRMDSKAFRRAVSLYDEKKDDLWSNLYYGVILGSAEVVEAVRKKLAGKTCDEMPQLRRLQSHGSVDERIDDYRKRLDISETEYQEFLRPVRRRQRPKRDLLMYLLWRDGHHTLAEIAHHFHVKYTAVCQARTRAEAILPNDRLLRRSLQAS